MTSFPGMEGVCLGAARACADVPAAVAEPTTLWDDADPSVALVAGLEFYLRRLFLPLHREHSSLIIAVADVSAENLAWLRARYGSPQFVSATKESLTREVERRFGDAMTDRAVFALARETPQLSARRVMTKRQVAAFSFVACALAAVAFVAPLILLSAAVLSMSAVFLVSVLFRAALAWLGALPGTPPQVAPARACDAGLPHYTILVPLYREAGVLAGLAAALRALDYPREHLQILLIVEADDVETVSTAAEICRSAPFEIVVVPPSHPRTKPKATNFALPFARGDFVVIFDAEDRPEPDQLRKAVGTFRRLPRNVACLQARLAPYNLADGWLVKLFAIDFELWFCVFLPGLERLGLPMPLGGTSNHFRASALRAVNGWDPFNVTEDADLGIRFAALGFRVAMLDSTTFEEAPTQLGAWIRQRSRWLKGYMQTWLVHVRHPGRMIRQVGVGGFLAFQLFIGGAVLAALFNPLLWAIFALSYFVPLPLLSDHGGHSMFYVSAAGAIGSNGLLTYLAVAGSPRERRNFVPYGLTVTLYWIFVSIAGYRGLWHLIRKPFHWEKTAHGLGGGTSGA